MPAMSLKSISSGCLPVFACVLCAPGRPLANSGARTHCPFGEAGQWRRRRGTRDTAGRMVAVAAEVAALWPAPGGHHHRPAGARRAAGRTGLARRYGGGLAGIREALARLALEGLVQRRARVGTMVAPLDLMEAREAFEARALIEVECARLAAPSASERGDRRHPRHAGKTAKTAVRDNDARALAAMDEAFHVAVAPRQRQPHPGQDGR